MSRSVQPGVDPGRGPGPATGLPAGVPPAVRLPELLAPAGDWECARAAVENGADAVYFGLDRFNARMRAANFKLDDLPRLMDFLHRRGVRGYLSFNTLVFAGELAAAEDFLRRAIACGVDAAIVQDVGVCRLIRRLSPDFPIHASTQMTVTSRAGLELAADLGCRRVVLARECTLRDIERIRADSGGALIELEVFVHGALCVAYSGQCLTSEALGGRSANRGECAQACRLPYELVADGRTVDLGDRRYLLSPQDLAGVEVLPDLVRLGVRSLKIEGRLKSPLYVANITRVYRDALDALAANEDGAGTREEARRYAMEMAFSRGLHTGWFRGINNQALVHGRFGTKRGVYLGRVRRAERERVAVTLEGPLKPGDGVVFDAGQPEQPEEGGRVYGIEEQAGLAWLSFGRGDVDFRRINVGDRLWKTSDPELERRLRRTFAGDDVRFQRRVDFEVVGRPGQALVLVARDEAGGEVRLESGMVLVAAAHQPLSDWRLREHLGRLGGTPFRLGTLRNRIEGAAILPVRELNRLRREAVARLEAARLRRGRWQLLPPVNPEPVPAAATRPAGDAAELIVLVRREDQLEVAMTLGIRTVYCEFEDPKKYRAAVARFRQRPATGAAGARIYAVPPRVTKPGEDWILRQVRSSEADGYLVRNADQLAFFGGGQCVGDYTLNVANSVAAGYFLRHYGLERVTASYDLNNGQLEDLVRGLDPTRLEVVVHQHMPMFHMEHCVFCAFLTRGTDYTDCGRPCDRQRLRLRDRVGAEHPVLADAGCRNTVFNAAAQTGAEYVSRLVALGVRHFRLEFLDEAPAVVDRTIRRYEDLLRGRISGTELWRELRLRHQLGVTRGSLDGRERPVTVL